jgi:hypothetical protein
LNSISRRSNGIYRQSSVKADYFDDFNYNSTSSSRLNAASATGSGQLSATGNSPNNYLLAPVNPNEDSGSPYSPGTASYGTDNSYNSLPRGSTSILKNGNGSLRNRDRYFQQQQQQQPLLQRQYSDVSRQHYESDFPPAAVLRPLQSQMYNHFEDNFDGGFDNSYNNTTSYNTQQQQHPLNNGVLNHSDLNNHSDTVPGLEVELLDEQQLLHNTTLLPLVKEIVEEIPAGAYPAMSKPSPSLQIIATRNRPCCECVKKDNRAPICLLFLIFLVVSVSVISGVMVYLKSGKKILLIDFLYWLQVE